MAKEQKQGKIYYYVRVSTLEQKVDRQLVAYDKANHIYIDKVSGKDTNRPQLQEMLANLKENDLVVVKSLDRLSRSTKDMIELAEEIKSKGANLKVLDLQGMTVDTSTPIGEFMFTMFSALAQLERKTIEQRTKEGIAIAKEQCKFKGRKEGSIILKDQALKRYIMLYNAKLKITQLADEFNVTRKTIYKWNEVLEQRGLINAR